MINKEWPERIISLIEKCQTKDEIEPHRKDVATIIDMIILDMEKGFESWELSKEARRLVREYRMVYNEICRKQSDLIS
jgi:hypothetical protein